MELFIVGKHIAETDKGGVWEFQGVFDSEDKAVKACIKEHYFVGPAKLNDIWPDESVKWPGAYYPLLEEKKI